MTTAPSEPSARISGILEALTQIKAKRPTTLDEIAAARRFATQAVADARRVNERAVYNSMQEQLGLATIEEFDALVLTWLSSDASALQEHLETHASSRSRDADLAAIRAFFEPRTPTYWWVNQGQTYNEERRGGYIWAPQANKQGRPLQHHVNVSRIQLNDIIFHYSQGALRAVSRALEAGHEAQRPQDLPTEPWERNGYICHLEYYDVPLPIPLAHIPSDWRVAESGPFNRDGGVNQGYLYQLSIEFVSKLVTKFKELDALPIEFFIRARDIWYVQNTPEAFELTLKSAKVGAWSNVAATRFKDIMGRGDILFFWQTGDKPGIRAIGECIGDPEGNMLPAGTYGASDTGPPQPQWYVKFEYTHIFEQPISQAALAVDPVLQAMNIFPTAEATNFRVTEEQWSDLRSRIEHLAAPVPKPEVTPPAPASYLEPTWRSIVTRISDAGLRIPEQTLRRYHLSLKTRGFVILSGLSGSGKTWLAQAYAAAVGAKAIVVPVAPNWNTNEDLLGYFNPMDNLYHDTPFSRFLREASAAHTDASATGVRPQPYHLILDEMNLARVEYYFARFLSAMELRARDGRAPIELGPKTIHLPPNLFFVGTVNIDETTHGFADKIYDRAQLIEITVDRADLEAHIADRPYRQPLLAIWDAVHDVAPFAFRVLDDIARYVEAAQRLDVRWHDALDEQLLQKVLPKLKGADPRVGEALETCLTLTADHFPLSHAKAQAMREGFRRHGFASYF